MTIRKLEKNEYESAVEIAWISFMNTEADFYSEDGIKEFRKIISNKTWLDSLEIYGAFINDLLIGIIATEDCGKHISLFFVSPRFQGHGVGRQLFSYIRNKSLATEYTVNSSRFAKNVYSKLGFTATDSEQNSRGIIFTPMMLKCA